MTAITEIINEALKIIDDVRMQEGMFESPALFYRRMSAYVETALPLLSAPPELYAYLTEEYVKPEYSDYTWVSTTESLEEEIQLDTGAIGYDICSVSIRSEDGTYFIPYGGVTYDSETGTVTFPIQEEEGVEYSIDFYKDGSVNDLTLAQRRLFGLAVATVWDERLNHNWLNIQMKVKDNAFDTVNESNYMDKMTLRITANRQAFQDELRKYEQNNAYVNVINPYGQRRLI